jgi:hypothetical protein
MKNITFTSRYDVPEEFYPRPASQNLPEWFTKMHSYGGFGNSKESVIFEKKVYPNGDPNATIKKCVPVLDVMTAGYILVTPSDIWVEIPENDHDQIYTTRGPGFKITTHANGQAPKHPSVVGNKDIPKFSNPWLIKTPPGYSVLITSPMHNPNGYFTCLPGVVDTDAYTQEINFPFTLINPNFTGLIPAGTPMVQVIPFKRDSWEMKIGGEAEIKEADKVNSKHITRMFNSYKVQWWSKKEFK